MKYLFVMKNNAWWVVIDSVEKLSDYYDKTSGKWEDAFDSLIHSKEFFNDGNKHASTLAYTIGTYGAKRGMSAIIATADFRSQIYKNQLDLITSGYKLYINSQCGYHYNHNGDEPHTQFVWRDEFVFPDFKKKDIRIKRYFEGQHFYAFVGDMQVRDGDILKWNTYEEAMEQALKVVNKK